MRTAIAKLVARFKKRKGLSPIVGAVLGLSLMIIIASIMIRVTQELKIYKIGNDATGTTPNETIGSHHRAVNTTAQYGMDALRDLAEQTPLLALIIIFGVIIAGVITFFPTGKGGGGSFKTGGGRL